MGKKTKISSFESTWSPVVGCRHGCNYCYARRIADRFAGFDKTEENLRKYAITGYKGQNIYTVYSPMTRTTNVSGEEQRAAYPFGFEPTLFSYMLNVPMTWKEPKDIFVCSMADLFGQWVPDKWIMDVFNACDKAPQHRYFFLTKNPQRYLQLQDNGLMPKNLENKWFGSSVTDKDSEYFMNSKLNTFVSVEPILEDLGIEPAYGCDWVIVGAETGNRMGKVKPKKEWIEHVVEGCRKYKIPLFMKDSLQKLMGDDFIQEKP